MSVRNAYYRRPALDVFGGDRIANDAPSKETPLRTLEVNKL
jgi:hypothetical protein